MQTTIKIPEHHVKFFTDMAEILNSDMRTLMEDYLEGLRIAESDEPDAVAYSAILHADNKRHASRIANRAARIFKKRGMKAPSQQRLMLHYEFNTRKITDEELSLMSRAIALFDGDIQPDHCMDCADCEDDSDNNAGEEWKKQ